LLIVVLASQVIETDRWSEVQRYRIELQKIPHHAGKRTRAVNVCGHNRCVGKQREECDTLSGLLKLAIVTDSSLRKYSNAAVIAEFPGGHSNAGRVIACAIDWNDVKHSIEKLQSVLVVILACLQKPDETVSAAYLQAHGIVGCRVIGDDNHRP
jgi:hypothetical protein